MFKKTYSYKRIYLIHNLKWLINMNISLNCPTTKIINIFYLIIDKWVIIISLNFCIAICFYRLTENSTIYLPILENTWRRWEHCLVTWHLVFMWSEHYYSTIALSQRIVCSKYLVIHSLQYYLWKKIIYTWL